MGKKAEKTDRPGRHYQPTEAESLLTEIIRMPQKIQRSIDEVFRKIPPRLVLVLASVLVSIGGLLWYLKFLNDSQCLVVVMVGILAVRLFGFDHLPDEVRALQREAQAAEDAKKGQ